MIRQKESFHHTDYFLQEWMTIRIDFHWKVGTRRLQDFIDDLGPLVGQHFDVHVIDLAQILRPLRFDQVRDQFTVFGNANDGWICQ
jgi:hypothetical protein